MEVSEWSHGLPSGGRAAAGNRRARSPRDIIDEYGRLDCLCRLPIAGIAPSGQLPRSKHTPHALI